MAEKTTSDGLKALGKITLGAVCVGAESLAKLGKSGANALKRYLSEHEEQTLPIRRSLNSCKDCFRQALNTKNENEFSKVLRHLEHLTKEELQALREILNAK